eukprot:TRINITY_DN67661_c0_g1_i1.p2 TRINITY_DN67661_c0_g1~~TRINITY_DN67661_c0_g1_i1.p2  ORF type:complete len:144 (+),score=59.22 TRINITY_DN67661_c0_g1_i1:37-432(+)
MGVVDDVKLAKEPCAWKTVLVLDAGAVLLDEPAGSSSEAAHLASLVKLTREEAVAKRVTLGGSLFEIHNLYQHEGATVLTGRQPVDAKATDVPCPDGWCCVSRGAYTIAVTYPISTTSASSIRQLLSILPA